MSHRVTSRAKKSEEQKKKQIILGDDAIDSPDTDWFDFATPASVLSKQLFEIAKSSGVCCAIIGPWGTGKSSFMKLLEKSLKTEYPDKVCIAWFTAWDPGGIEDLGDSMLFHFMHKICADANDKNVASALKDLDEALGVRKSAKARVGQAISVLGKFSPDIARPVFDATGAILDEMDSPARVKKSFDAVVEWLEANDKTAFFFIDDLDRSAGEQIRDLLSELKVYASRHRIVAVLGYDEDYILNALKSSLPLGIDPKKFVEKIATFRRSLPAPSEDNLSSLASAILKSTLDIGEVADRIADFAVRAVSCNPRRLKKLMLTYVGLICGQISASPKNERKTKSENYLFSALLACATEEMGLLTNEELREAIEWGLGDKVVSALNSIKTKQPSEIKNVEFLIDLVDYLKPAFGGGIITDLRLASIALEGYGMRRSSEAEESRFDWTEAFEPILTKAAKAGFELDSNVVSSSGKIVVPPSGKLVNPEGFLPAQSRTSKSILRKALRYNSVKSYGLEYPKLRILVSILGHSENERMDFVDSVLDLDAELTYEKPFVLWVIDEFGDLETQLAISGCKRRSKSFKNPFVFAVTKPSQINCLLDLLIEQATKKAK